MLFTSLAFIIFFFVFFFLYWFVLNRNLRVQNGLILLGSYFFYCWWDWRFLSLLVGYSLLNYFLGLYIYKANTQKAKNIFLYIGVLAGVGSLIYFKYTNFFITSFIEGFARFNIQLSIKTISIALPLGISFYTFKTLSYLFDIHKGKLEPVKDIVLFSSFIAFFPSLIAGPIDKAQTLIPQLSKKREFVYEDATDGVRQIIYGFFKKLVIADSLSTFTDNIFDNYHSMPGSTLVIGAFYYSIQIYADFSGYSDMAIGFARLLGFKITNNFEYPYFAQNVGEYWRRWHISLTKWLTEYVFTPLSIAFRDYGQFGLILAIVINLTVIGAWHGARWTFVVFGFLHGLYFIPLILKGTMNKKVKRDPNKKLPNLNELGHMLKNMAMVTIAFVFFRSDTLSQAFGILKKIASRSLLEHPTNISLRYLLVILAFMIVEWIRQNPKLKISLITYRPVFYVLISIMVFLYFGKQASFIYFKF